MSRTTVVIGAGITGLSAAHRLASETDDTIIVCESAPRLGGKLHRTELDPDGTSPELVDGPRAATSAPAQEPFTVDVGAESLLARRPEGLNLIGALGLEDRLVHPSGARAQAYLDRMIKPLPASNMGIPTDPDALTGYLSADGVRRARAEPDLPAPALSADVEIGRYVADRFGDEVTDRLLEPMLGGVYAGRSRRLSFEAVHPTLYAAARGGGSLLAAARTVAARARRGDEQSTEAPPVFAGLRGGIAGMISALADDLGRRGVTIRTGTTVRGITHRPGGYQLITGPVPRPEPIMADRILIAVPATPAARLLRPLSGDAADALAQIPYASMAVITFVLAGAELSGSGLLVPPGELPTIKAFTHTHTKWPWVAEQAADRFGPGTAVVRASIGRFGEESLLQVDDHELITRTFAEARGVPGWSGARLLDARVQRWGGGLPQYLLGHRDRIGAIRGAVAELPGVALAGAYTDGVGLPACIGSGRLAVEALLG